MKLLEQAQALKPEQVIIGAGIFTAICISVGLYLDIPVIIALPFLAVSALVLLYDYRAAYYLLMISLPWSVAYTGPGGINTDMPSEPLMLVLTACFLLSAAINKPLSWEFISHPICRIIALMIMWAIISSLFSVDATKSVKYILAKIWYLVTFILVTGAIIKSVEDLRRICWFFMISLAVVVAVSLVKHAALGFAFDMVNRSVWPFFYNHVIYAAAVAMFVPFTFLLWQQAKNQFLKRLIVLGILVLFLLAIGLSYTRASWLSIPVALIYLFILRFNLTRLVLIASVISVIAAGIYLVRNNNYQLYAPDFATTVYHGGNIEKHLEATYSLEDVSGMERVYRWVAAARMAHDNPIAGTGPNTFYPEYKKYTVSNFITYVSRNPEKSTTHNYFLMTMAEQGVPGLILFTSLVFYALLLGQRLYNQAIDKQLKQTIVAAILSIVITVFHLLLNELIEVDKIGSFFYIALAILIRIDIWQRAHNDLLKPAR